MNIYHIIQMILNEQIKQGLVCLVNKKDQFLQKMNKNQFDFQILIFHHIQIRWEKICLKFQWMKST